MTILIFILLYFNLIKPSSIPPIVTQNAVVGSPARLRIPSIYVDAAIQPVGFSATGTMEVPTKAIDVSWFEFGPRPGEQGSAVIAGHLNNPEGEDGVFADLSKLKAGDKLYVENTDNKTVEFIVSGSQVFEPGYADEVFGSNDDAHLNLVTCDGIWEETENSYSKRLVVFADISH